MTVEPDLTTPKPLSSDVELASTGSTFARQIIARPELAVIAFTILFVLFVATQGTSFFTPLNLANLFRDWSFLAIVASFTAIVFVAGGLDLSVGSTLMAGAMSSAAVAASGAGTPAAIAAGLVTGAFIGLINGLLINLASLPPIIVTLGTLFIVRSLVTTISEGKPVSPLPDDFVVIGQSSLWGIPVVVLAALIVCAIAFVILHLMIFGWNVRAIGGNRDAARNAGIKVIRTSVIVYVLSGTAAAFAGTLLAARLGAGSTTLGNGYELQAIAATVIGGISIFGAVGSIPGAMLGALLLTILANGLVLLKVPPTLQQLAIGAVLIIAAVLDQVRRQNMFRASVKRVPR